MGLKDQLVKKADSVYELPVDSVEGQKVPVIFYVNDTLYEFLEEDAVKQAANAALLPGVQKAVYVMPDVHVGYGFPVGGVMATSIEDGIISPGSVGYDINCGVRLIATNLTEGSIGDKVKGLMNSLLREIPAGVGSTGDIRLTKGAFQEVVLRGAAWAVDEGYGFEEDLDCIESYGAIKEADPGAVSEFAFQRGGNELGTVGSGNHFVEIQVVDEVFDRSTADRIGIVEGQVMIMVHSGSRGFGHQICVDYLKVALEAAEKYGINLPDPQLACMPFSSEEGMQYFKAMCAAANYAFANRQILGFKTADAIRRFLGLSWEEFGYKLIYDHAHNIAKLENHKVNGGSAKVVVHRKGATRSFPPFSEDVPPAYRELGQPVIIPGDMGRASFLLFGNAEAMNLSFGTACHGAGRLMSRRKAKKLVKEIGFEKIISGLTVVARGKGTIMEEIPQAYKDVTEVVSVIDSLGIARIVARLKPVGTLKG